MVAISDIWGLQHSLDEKAGSEHEHHIRAIVGLKEGLDNKAESDHDHPLATAENPGFLSVADKLKIDGLTAIEAANIYISTVEGLSDALSQKAAVNHGHTIATSTTSGFLSASDKSKLDSLSTSGSGASTIAQVAGLQAALDGKATTDSLTGLLAGLQTGIDAKADAGHSHTIASSTANGFMSSADKVKLDSLSTSGGGASTIAQVAGLQAALDSKAATGHTHTGLPNLSPAELAYTASQSTTYGSTPAATYTTLTDGSFTTGTGTNSNTATSWIQADLGSVKSISQVWIGGGTIPNGWGTAAGYLNGSTLEISSDGSTWAIVVLSLAQIIDTAVTRFSLGGALARYVRVRKDSNFIGLGEFRIVG